MKTRLKTINLMIGEGSRFRHQTKKICVKLKQEVTNIPSWKTQHSNFTEKETLVKTVNCKTKSMTIIKKINDKKKF